MANKGPCWVSHAGATKTLTHHLSASQPSVTFPSSVVFAFSNCSIAKHNITVLPNRPFKRRVAPWTRAFTARITTIIMFSQSFSTLVS